MKPAGWLPAVALTMAAIPLSGQQRGTPVSITLHEPQSPFIAFNIWIRAGSQNDPPGKEGLAALTANLLAEGSTTADRYDAILAKLYPMAAGYGYSVDKEMTVFRGRVHRDNLEAWYTLFRNAVLQPAFGEEDFQRVKTQTVNFLERARRYSRDEELSKELLFWMAYRGTPYEHPEEGYVQSVKAISLDDVKAFYRDHYTRGNAVVGVAGGYPEGFAARVRTDFDALPAREAAAVPAPDPAPPSGIKVLIVEKPTDATAISLGFPYGLVRGHPDYFALMTANAWFGEHRNSFSHLYQVIREARGMNYGDYSYIDAFPLGYTTQEPPVNVARRRQLFEIWIRPVSKTAADDLHDRALFATRAALRELTRLAEAGMTDSTLAETRQYLHNFSVTYGSTVSRRLAYAVDDAFYGLPAPGFLGSIRPALARLNRSDVNAAIRRHLQARNLYLVFITQDAEGLKRKLLAGTPTPIRYAGTKSAAHMAEDGEIAAFPIPVKEADITIVGINEVFEKGRS
jgi:zinc protease